MINRILVDNNGGLGDILIQKNFLAHLLKDVDANTVEITYCVKFKYLIDFAKKLFSDIPCVEITDKEYSSLKFASRIYHIQIQLVHGLVFDSFVIDNIIDCTLKFRLSKLYELYLKYEAYYEDNSYRTHRSRTLTNIIRSRIWRNNCYTMYNYDSNKPLITDWHVNIPMFNSYELDTPYYKKKYITVSTDWGGNFTAKDNSNHAKAWPLERYEILIKALKEKHPDIYIVQVEKDETRKLAGADYYMFKKSLESVKFILKNSILHICSEGGLAHLASQLGTKCAVLFGQSPLHFYGYEDNINIQEGSCHSCVQCFSDITVCLRGMALPECMDLITPEIVIDRILPYLEKKASV